MDKQIKKPKLWTHDFTIITLGSVVSMLGNAMSGFACGILVLDITNSVLLYAIFSIANNLPKIVMPLIAGPYLDRFSRKKTIYTLDFISAGLYLCIFLSVLLNIINYALFLPLAFIVGCIDSVYNVAYTSFYPNLVAKGNFSKAYSISSVMETLAVLMVPVAAWCYNTVGIGVLFAFNAVTFLIAAIFETQIKTKETHTGEVKKENLKQFITDFKEGIGYLKGEKGLKTINYYFFFSTMFGALCGTLVMPYFKADPSLGVELYTYVMICNVFGRMVGGLLHYTIKLPTKRKYTIALCVYFITTLINGTYLYLPVVVMMAMNFIDGFICVTSYNIRISSTQNYVPDEKRGRYNGVYQMLMSAGNIIGIFIAGALGDYLPTKSIITCGSACVVSAIFVFMVRNRKHVKLVYNKQV